jgi:ATP-dependent exoDNAse (exonuclease V) alpha subunit
MFGDFGQLPPVGDTALFDLSLRKGNSPAVLEVNYGREIYLSLSENLTLNRLMRQREDDDGTRQLRQILEHLRNDTISDEDCDILNGRTLQDLPPEQRAAFDNALYLCATNALVDNINQYRLGISNKPVLTLPAVHKGPGAKKASEDTAEGLESKLLLMTGAKVMITRNLWTSQGLTNGTIGTIGTNVTRSHLI